MAYKEAERKALMAVICERLAEGDSLRAICADETMPSRTTIGQWEIEDADFRAKCARACAIRADLLVDRMEEVEDMTLKGTLDPRAANVVLSSQRWRAEKLNRAKYGERTVIAGDPDAPLAATINMAGATPEQLRAIASLKLPNEGETK